MPLTALTILMAPVSDMRLGVTCPPNSGLDAAAVNPVWSANSPQFLSALVLSCLDLQLIARKRNADLKGAINCKDNRDSIRRWTTIDSPKRITSSVRLHLSLNVFLVSFHENPDFMSGSCPASVDNYWVQATSPPN